MPAGLEPFPAYLGKAGYHRTNVRKTDYNMVVTRKFWDKGPTEAAWRGREDGQPFFHVRTFGDSHEGSLHVGESELNSTGTHPDQIAILPCYPDTPTFRKTAARYHDRMKKNDEQIGRVVAELKKDGILEDTFIFVFGDHGGVLPRGKGYLYDMGTHIPLVVRIPENFRHLVDAERGTRVSGFVNFTDFGPTVLKLAGVEIPEGVDGRPFLGKGVRMEEVNQRDETFYYADRFDEKYEMVRAIRKGRFKYMRFYEGFYPDGLQNNYRYKMLAYQEWRKLHQAGKLKDGPAQFFESKPAEGLYDLEKDPAELNNLAHDPSYKAKLNELRKALSAKVKSLPDLSFFPESVIVQHLDDPTAFGQKRKSQIGRLVDTADLALLSFEAAQPELEKALQSEDPWIRYWALMACSHFGDQAIPLLGRIEDCLTHEEPLVGMRAAEYLAITGKADPKAHYRRLLGAARTPAESLQILNSLIYLRDGLDRGYTFPFVRKDVAQVDKGQVPRRLQYLGWE